MNLYGFVKNRAIDKVDYLGLAIAVSKNPIPEYIYGVNVLGDGGGRGDTLFLRHKEVIASCSNDCFKIEGDIEIKIVMLEMSHPRWNERWPRYDFPWGDPRSNDHEFYAAYMHEMDHYKTFEKAADTLVTLNDYDEKYLHNCEERKGWAQFNINTLLFIETIRHSKFFDSDGWNTGLMYSQYPFNPRYPPWWR